MDVLQRPMVLVVGNSRSGTTLVARVLGRHPLIHTLRELHFFEGAWRPTESAPALSEADATALASRLLGQARGDHGGIDRGISGREVDEVLELAGSPRSAPAVFAAAVAHEAERHGKSIGCEQTPQNVFYLREIMAHLPNVRVVNVVRDPRDVLLSQKNWWRRRFRGSVGVPLRTTARKWLDYHPITTSLLWRGGVRAAEVVAGHPSVLTITFESLAADPEATLASMCEHIGIEPDPGMLQVTRISSSNSEDRSDAVGVDPTVVGRWREGLSTTEAYLCQRVNARECERYGYEIERVAPEPLRLAGTLLSWPVKTGLAVAANAGRTRNLLVSARRRLG